MLLEKSLAPARQDTARATRLLILLLLGRQQIRRHHYHLPRLLL